MDKVDRLKSLTRELNKASYAYYALDEPFLSDKQYDNLYDELQELESKTGISLASSPTKKVQGYVLDSFKKVEHSKPMLSAAKTKDTNEIEKFVNNKDFYGSYKLDGLTLVTRYKNGKFVQGITRGTGLIGEDVTEACRFISNLPMTIPYTGDLELRGECVVSWADFNDINEALENKYSHPRNLAAGSVRNLDLNIVKSRRLSFVVFECVTDIGIDSKLGVLKKIDKFGFETVERTKIGLSVDKVQKVLDPGYYRYPVDGIIFELDSRRLSESLGRTSHHESCRMALKASDSIYETKLEDIEWNTSKTGLINPVAIFSPVDIDGSIVTRATLHNISYIEELQLGIGDTIEVYKANMIIPKIHDNLVRSDTWELPSKCPSCGGRVEIHNENGSKTLHCTNPDCEAKLLARLVHFVSKNAINIEGMSEQTLRKLVDISWIKTFRDIYHLSEHKKEIYKMDGFGKKSADKLLENIEKSKNTTLERFIYSLSIPLIGRSASEAISKYCKKDINTFFKTISNKCDWTIIDDFGDVMCNSLNDFWITHSQMIIDLSTEFNFEVEKNTVQDEQTLVGKTFVITGSLKRYKNRNELVDLIEFMGGKVSGSVSAKTSYLINNDVTSKSGKNKKANELGIPILSEEDFIKMITSNT